MTSKNQTVFDEKENDEFNGENYHYLARKYRYSLAWVYALVSKGRQAYKDQTAEQEQLKIF